MRHLLALVVALSAAPAFAFGPVGHQMVCDMAYKLLSPTSQQKVDQLLTFHEEKHFGKACSWPDQVRALPEYKHTAMWHYVNIQRTDNSVSMAHCPEKGCVLSAISQQSKKLVPFAPSRAQLEALLFTGHFVGDLHQPLHAGYADDLGGNKTAVYFNGQPSNLHGVWDYVILEQAGYSADEKQQALYQDLLAKQQQWQSVNVLDWANESVMLVKLIYQGYKPGMLVDQTYTAEHLPQLEQRLQQAAVRLAYLLEQGWSVPASSAETATAAAKAAEKI
ncbi:S1/P1 nuclease [Rheinheimera sp.]|uniref:S1/P1 nuclease n=1 Tax=Rheinheimera sp. TaxID=1869214 RepID=UPI003AF43482